jgi:hypothetical protein
VLLSNLLAVSCCLRPNDNIKVLSDFLQYLDLHKSCPSLWTNGCCIFPRRSGNLVGKNRTRAKSSYACYSDWHNDERAVSDQRLVLICLLYAIWLTCIIKVAGGIIARLAPLFTVSHATRGKLSGPYSKLPPALKRLTLDTVFALLTLHGSDVDGADLREAVASATSGTEDGQYWARLESARTVLS